MVSRNAFLKLNSWSPWAGFNPIISIKGIDQIKNEIVRKYVLCIQKDLLHF